MTREEKRDYMREYMRQYRHTPAGKKYNIARSKKRNDRYRNDPEYREKMKACSRAYHQRKKELAA